ncbi:MAG: EAL domain-containing protein [Eubacteriales bacterium]
MLAYNFAGEFAMLMILAVAGYSFGSNYKQNTSLNRILKGSYVVALLSISSSFFAGMLNTSYAVGDGLWILYLANGVYFALVPSFITGYLVFCMIISTHGLSLYESRRKLVLCILPHACYILLLVVGIYNHSIFWVTKEEGYVSGPWFQFPYYFACTIIGVILVILFRKRHSLNYKTIYVLLLSLLVALTTLMLQFIYPNMIVPVSMNVMSVLAAHMFLQNHRKSVDGKTDLNNFLVMKYHLEQRIKREEEFSIYVVGIRDLKLYTERNGLAFTDNLIRTIALGLLERFQYGEVYHYREEEFAIILDQHDNNHQIIQNFLEQYKKPICVEKEYILLQVVCARVDNKTFGTTMDQLISVAEHSLSILKQPYCTMQYLYDMQVVHDTRAKEEKIEQITYAINHRLFQICYQPMYSVTDHCFTQAEALVRMKGIDGAIIYPSDFIELAEETDLIIPMTYIILDIVCEDFRNLIDQFGENLLLESISVNFPYSIFLTQDMEERVYSILEKHHLTTQHIKIEITERTLIADNHLMTSTMYRMIEQGFVFELDDFGVEYSNVNTLLELPLTIIKIDRVVLLSAMLSDDNRAFFQHLTAGIRAIGCTIIVEGVEEVEQLEFILQSNCAYIQGYYFSKPLTYETLVTFIQPKNQREFLLQVMETN